MSENMGTKDAETAGGIGRRGVIGGGAALLAALAGASVAGVNPVAAEEAPPSSGEGPTPPNHTEGPSAVQLERMKAMQDWARSLALQGATFATPIVAMYLLRSTVAFGPSAKAAPGTIWNFDQIATPTIAAETGYVSPNVNVLYGFGFADLGQEPHILTVPDSDGRYFMIELVDMWTNAFAYPAGGASGYKGGKFALVGPGWQGELPPDVKRIDSATRWVELQPRVYVKNEADLPGARAVLHGIKLETLSAYKGAPAAAPAYDYEVPKVNPKVATSQMAFEDPLQFWSIFSAAMNENPPPESQIKAILPLLKYLGVELGKQWKPEAVNPLILEEMRSVAKVIGPTINLGFPLVGGRQVNGWTVSPYAAGNAGTDYMLASAVAVIGLTANATDQAIYYPGYFDANNQLLTGKKALHDDVRGAHAIRPGRPAGLLVRHHV